MGEPAKKYLTPESEGDEGSQINFLGGCINTNLHLTNLTCLNAVSGQNMCNFVSESVIKMKNM